MKNSALIAALLAFALTACGEKPAEAPATPAPAPAVEAPAAPAASAVEAAPAAAEAMKK